MSVVRTPARSSRIATAVPNEPAPTTAARLIGCAMTRVCTPAALAGYARWEVCAHEIAACSPARRDRAGHERLWIDAETRSRAARAGAAARRLRRHLLRRRLLRRRGVSGCDPGAR